MFERKKTTKYVKTLFQYKTTELSFHYREKTHNNKKKALSSKDCQFVYSDT